MGIDIEYLGTWCEMRGERVQRWRPLFDNLTFCIGIKNTGSVVIDHYVWKQTIDLSSTKVKLLHPKLPSQLWRPFASRVLASVFVREVRVNGDKIEVTNPVLNRVCDVVTLSTVSPGGIRQGETLIIGESRPYVDFLSEGVEAKGMETGKEARLDVVDREKGTVNLSVKELRLGPIAISDLKAQAVLRGKFKAAHEVSIDDKVFGSGEVEWEYI